MDLIEPALAHKFEAKRLAKGSWAVEEKFDGHRLLFEAPSGRAWSRQGNERVLPPHLLSVIRNMAAGVYDSEQIRRRAAAESKSYDVSRIDKPEEFRLVVFDMLVDDGIDMMSTGADYSWVQRQQRMKERMRPMCGLYSPTEDDFLVSISPTLAERVTLEQLESLMKAVTDRGGEGLMLKEMTSSYRPGKRMLQWLKIKREETAVGVLVGYQSGLMGPHSVAVVEHTDETSGKKQKVYMKAKDHEWLRRMDAEADKHLGRRVVFEYTERTSYGAFREPRWDRFEDE